MKIFHLLKPALCVVAMLLPFISFGQEIPGIPIGVFPMQYISAFAGEADAIRLNTSFAYGLGKREGKWRDKGFGYHVSYDQFIPAIGSGIGVSLHRASRQVSYPFSSPNGSESRHEMDFRSNKISLVIAPKFSIKGKYTISPSIDLSYGRGKTDANFNGHYGPISHGNHYSPGRHEWLESRLGLLFNSSKYYLGYSVYLLNRHYFNNENSGLFNNIYTSYVQVGYTFQRRPESKFSFTPQIAYRIGGFKEMTARNYHPNEGAINLTFRYDKYLAGLNNFGFHLGWQTEKFRVMVNNNPWSNADVPFYGNGQIALRYIFSN